MASYNVYVINLDRDLLRWKEIQSRLNAEGFVPIRFSACDGATLSDNDLLIHNSAISWFGRHLCPRSALGCALSHWLLSKKFSEEDPNDVCLVLEDDTQPVLAAPRSVLEQTLREAPPDWDIIKFDYWPHLEIKGYRSIRRFPSLNTGAYLINKRGAQKWISQEIHYHIDTQWTLQRNLNIYHSPHQLFRQGRYQSHNTLKNRWNPLDIKRFRYKLLRAPGIGIELTCNDALLIALITIFVGLMTRALAQSLP